MRFEELFGFRETSPETVKQHLSLIEGGTTLVSDLNDICYRVGGLEIPTLKELRSAVEFLHLPTGIIKVTEVVEDITVLHSIAENHNAVFQVASQLNLLEMRSPKYTPEMGISIYENDRTQGPACALACMAGTVFRNYFVEVDGELGQTEKNQIDCSELLGGRDLWNVVNGYLVIGEDQLKEVSSDLFKLNIENLKVGVQWQTAVTLPGTKHLVSQVYCSALPVAYSNLSKHLWKDFSIEILKAAYEATLCTAILNFHKTGVNKVYLTLLGGGAFGNDIHWIMEAMSEVISKYKHYPLDVRIVSFRKPNLILSEYFKLNK